MEDNPMFSKPKSWLSGGLWKPKNPHSLEHLKYLHGVVCKNPTVTEQNRALLVETLRSISEILIWGDQNDSSVFDFFLEKNMLGFFLRFMKQKYGRFICVQLLQTLNILFENISNETSVYYLLSNNHINSIIVHKFDFSDEEVMAYYISFLKTLSLKLNKHTIHFFYNEHTNDFALYTEAIKFFNHSESMVRIAVRTITLNVYKACHYTSKTDASGKLKVEDKSMLRFIRDKTAAPYFSNLVWFIGNHVLELDICVRHDIDHNSRDRLADLVAEHLDHLHYLNDILCLNIHALNEVLTDHLLNRLLIPLYVHSLTQRKRYLAAVGGKTPPSEEEERPHVQCVVSLFLLSQVFLIMHHAPLVRQLAHLIFHAQHSVFSDSDDDASSSASPAARSKASGHRCIREFVKPTESLAKTLDSARGGGKPMKRPNYKEEGGRDSEATEAGEEEEGGNEAEGKQEGDGEEDKADEAIAAEGEESPDTLTSPLLNSTDDEKLMTVAEKESASAEFTLENKPYLAVVFKALECEEDDYEALFTLCLLYAIGHNNGINQELLDSIFMPSEKSASKEHYNVALVEQLINIIRLSCQNNSHVRLATLELCIKLLKTLVYSAGTTSPSSSSSSSTTSTTTAGKCYLQDRHLAAVEGAREEATLLLRNFYKVWEKSEEIFLDMFEDEFREMKNRPLNVEYLTMDASILLPPTGTPLTGIDFNKRLPCGEVERARRAIRVFFYLRDLSLSLQDEDDQQLPLTRSEECVKLGDVLDLNNSDLIACTVISKDNKRERRFLVIDVLQLILVEPDSRRLGWGKVRFVGFLQDVEVAGDKEDSRSLHITIHKPSLHNAHARPLPLLSARFTFDDHIRCMAARQRLGKGRLRARQRKMQMIARLLQLPASLVDAMYQPAAGFTTSAVTLRANRSRTGSSASSSTASHPGRAQSEMVKQSVFASVDKTNAFDSARSQDMASKEARHLPRQSSRSKPGGATAVSKGTGNSVIKPAATGILSPQQQARLKKKAEKVAKARQAAREQEASTSAAVKSKPEPSTPEAKAFQSLNQSSQKPKEESKSGGKLSRNSSTGSLTKEVEIPLEDLSQKAAGGVRRLQLSEGSKSRSSSYSPSRRGRRLSSDSATSSRNTSRSPLSVHSSGSAGSDRRERAGSCPSPRPSLSRSNSATGTVIDVTSFIKSNPDRRRARAERIVIGQDAATVKKASGENVASAVKTRSDTAPSLTPAAAAPLSLVTCDITTASDPALASPIIVAPADIDADAGRSQESVFFPKPPAKTTAGVELSTASPERKDTGTESVSTKDELSRIAKIPSDSSITQEDGDSLELSPVAASSVPDTTG